MGVGEGGEVRGGGGGPGQPELQEVDMDTGQNVNIHRFLHLRCAVRTGYTVHCTPG